MKKRRNPLGAEFAPASEPRSPSPSDLRFKSSSAPSAAPRCTAAPVVLLRSREVGLLLPAELGVVPALIFVEDDPKLEDREQASAVVLAPPPPPALDVAMESREVEGPKMGSVSPENSDEGARDVLGPWLEEVKVVAEVADCEEESEVEEDFLGEPRIFDLALEKSLPIFLGILWEFLFVITVLKKQKKI